MSRESTWPAMRHTVPGPEPVFSGVKNTLTPLMINGFEERKSSARR